MTKKKTFKVKNGIKYRYSKWVTKDERKLLEGHKQSSEYLFIQAGSGFSLYLSIRRVEE